MGAGEESWRAAKPAWSCYVSSWWQETCESSMLVDEVAMGEVVAGLVCEVASLVCSSWSMGKRLCELAGSVGTTGYGLGCLVQVWLVCWVCSRCS